MQIFLYKNNFSNNNYTKKQQICFGYRGKPLALKETIIKNERLIPKRVLEKAKYALANFGKNLPSLKDIHLETYAPLLQCKSLDEAKKLFPEFENITENFEYIRASKHRKSIDEQNNSNFALRMLQEIWAKLKTKDEIVKDLGFPSRNTLEWPLKKINFVSYSANYKTILNASDPEGNRVIAEKTRAYNQKHPEKMFAKNKKAAQACKSKEYREAQSKRMKEYDIDNPERIQKIIEHDKLMWSLCPEVRQAMSKFTLDQPLYVRSVLAKRIKGYRLTPKEKLALKGLNEKFWETYPEYKEVLAEANKKAKTIRNKKN